MKNKFFFSFLLSVITHLIFFALLFIKIHRNDIIVQEEKSISFEPLPLKEVSNIKTKKIQKGDEKGDIEDAKKVTKTQDPIKQEQPKEESQSKEEPKKEEIKKPEPVPEPKPKEEPKKEDIVKEKVVEKKKPEPVQEPPKKKQPTKKNDTAKKKNEEVIDSLLKTLEKASEGTKDISNKTAQTKKKNDVISESIGSNVENQSPETIAIKNLIQSKIEKHWHMTGYDENTAFKILLVFNPDGSVANIKIIESICSLDEGICESLRDGIRRAINLASPYEELLNEKYEKWHEFELVFKPE